MNINKMLVYINQIMHSSTILFLNSVKLRLYGYNGRTREGYTILILSMGKGICYIYDVLCEYSIRLYACFLFVSV